MILTDISKASCILKFIETSKEKADNDNSLVRISIK